MAACTQWTHSDVWLQLATTPEWLCNTGDRLNEKARWNSNWRVLSNVTRCIDAGCGVIHHTGVSDWSYRVHLLQRSHSAWTEFCFADKLHNGLLIGVGVVQPFVIAAYRFATALALYMVPLAALQKSAVWAYIHESFDLIPHYCSLDAFFDQSICHHVSLHYQLNWECGDLPTFTLFSDAMRVHQPLHLDRHHHFFIRTIDFVPHLLQALCTFANVSHKS